MAEVYVTLGEAAELERVKYNTMVKRVLRKQESFVTKTEKSENGGKDVVLVAVSSLSKQARNAWKEREKLKSFTEEFPDKKEDEQKPEVPWYVNTDVDWYIENYKERYYKAVELGNVVRKFLQYDEGDRTKYAEEFAQKYLGKGQRTLYRYTKAWGIKNPFFFQKKVFYWGTKEEQKEIYVLEEGETILSLNKYGDLWEAETIAIPWIHHSQEVEVQHSKYSGIVTVEKTIVRV